MAQEGISKMSEPSVFVASRPGEGLVFDVIVRDARGESRHQVTMQADESERWAKLAGGPSRCVEAMMRFLLDREPKESILNAFDMRVVRRYFPEFDDAFPAYLARLSGEARSRA
jgi:hypothetical protein